MIIQNFMSNALDKSYKLLSSIEHFSMTKKLVIEGSKIQDRSTISKTISIAIDCLKSINKQGNLPEADTTSLQQAKLEIIAQIDKINCLDSIKIVFPRRFSNQEIRFVDVVSEWHDSLQNVEILKDELKNTEESFDELLKKEITGFNFETKSLFEKLSSDSEYKEYVKEIDTIKTKWNDLVDKISREANKQTDGDQSEKEAILENFLSEWIDSNFELSDQIGDKFYLEMSQYIRSKKGRFVNSDPELNYAFNKNIMRPLVWHAAFEQKICEHIKSCKENLMDLFDVHVDKIEEISFPERPRSPSEILVPGIKLNTETHHMGRKTEKVELKFCDQEGKSYTQALFYKPRSADIDLAVIDYLSRFNTSTESFFPTRKDVVIVNGSSDEGSYSLWKEVKGLKLNVKKEYPIHDFDDISSDSAKPSSKSESSRSIYDEIDSEDSVMYENIKNRNEVKEELIKQLGHLDRALSFIGISDLHNENIVIVGLQNDQCDLKKIKIIPIDLEVMRPGYPTLLFGDESWKKKNYSIEKKAWEVTANKNEERFISSFESSTKSTSKRVLLQQTNKSKIDDEFNSYILQFTSYLHAIREDGRFRLPITSSQKTNLRRLLVQSGVYKDVPYFTLLDNQLGFTNGKNFFLISDCKQ